MGRKHPSLYAISDLHFTDSYIATASGFERTQFETIEEHDAYIIQALREWSGKAIAGSTLYVLGDFGNVDKLYDFFNAVHDKGKAIHTVFVYGNHDKLADYDKFAAYFDEVYRHPIFLTNRLVLSHEPIWPVPGYMINVHGHLHNAHLDSPNHLTVSCNDIKYKPVDLNKLQSTYAKIDDWNMNFLWEPYAEAYIFHENNRRDTVCNPKTGKIDLSASRALQKYYKGTSC